MKKLMVMAALIMGISGLALAQKGTRGREKATPEKRAELMTAAMDEQLHLSAEQRNNVYALNLNRAKSRPSIKTGAAKGDREAMKAARKADRKQLLSLLNADQKKAFKEFKGKKGKHGAKTVKNPKVKTPRKGAR